ncbi:MAG: HAD-IA family hydrolase [Rhodospirillales bacterium]|nr:HAD-IA family hydrolase [Rhodospirillales bacterium]
MSVRLVIFDCDGVLIDSEAVANRVSAEAIGELGWRLTAAECEQRFLGMSLADMGRAIAAARGIAVPAAWEARLVVRLAEALGRDAVTVPGAEAALRAVAAMGFEWRIASNSGVAELAAKFAATGLAALVAGRVHSAETVIARGGRGKPAPDLFLEAAHAAGVTPSYCVVVEDSIPGVRGAVAAGMRCLGFAPHGDGAALHAAGAEPFHALAALPALLAAGRVGAP